MMAARFGRTARVTTPPGRAVTRGRSPPRTEAPRLRPGAASGREARTATRRRRWPESAAPRRRAEWQLDETLRQTGLLSGLLAFENRRYEQAADRFREAGKAGLRDRRLGSLLILALVKAGQRLLYDQVK